MLTPEEQRVHLLAQMAATLEAGDRAAVLRDGGGEGQANVTNPKAYARRAMELFNAVHELTTSWKVGPSE